MAGPGLIGGYVAELAAKLPHRIVAELADGLHETYQHHQRRGLSADDAARAAIGEFGEPAVLVAAFVASNPARRWARLLLLTGPVVGGAWASALVVGHAWDWPVAAAARVGFGAALVSAVVLLGAAAFGVRYRQAGRRAAAASTLVLMLDLTMLGYVTSAGILVSWPVLLSASLSAMRTGVTLQRLPQLLTCC